MVDYHYDSTELVALVILSISFFFLLSVNLIYWLFIRKRFVLAYRMVALLLLNQLLVTAAQLLPFLHKSWEVLCNISLVAKTFFTVATDFWICFIISIVYYSLVHPTKKITMGSYIGNRLFMTYIPSGVFAALLLLLMEVNSNTENIEQCWRSVVSGATIQYVIYVIAYIVPSVITLGIIIVYLCLYYRVKERAHPFNWFLLFPMSQLVFSSYFLTLKIYLLVESKGMPNGEIINLLEPLLYGVIFVGLLVKHRGAPNLDSSLDSEDMSLGSSLRRDD